MILKIVFYEKEEKENPRHRHTRFLDVYDFHIETRSKEKIKKDPYGTHEIVYHAITGEPGVLRVGFDEKYPDHVYVMEGGKTVDHMRFYAN